MANSKAKLGNDWTYKIYFDPEADEPIGQRHEFEDEDLIKELKLLVDVDEEIIQVTVFKLPLTTMQLTQAVFFHNFVLFKTQSWWWTIEKNSEGITIQRSKSQQAVKDYFRRNERNPGMKTEVEDSGKKNVGDLIQWLYKENKLNKSYNVYTSNCQHFAKAAFNFVAKNKKF